VPVKAGEKSNQSALRPRSRPLIHTNLHAPEKVLAARKAAHEQQSVKPLINFLRLFLDQLYGLDDYTGPPDSGFISGLIHDEGTKIETDLIDNWFKNLPAQQVSGDGQFTIEKPHIRVIRVLYVETGKVEHLFCSPETKHG